MKTTKLTVFRCDQQFREQMEKCARKMQLDVSSYLRWAVINANRTVNGHGTGVRVS